MYLYLFFPPPKACNIISQTPSGRFTLVVPYQHQNCSFSIIYPVTIKISDLALGHLHGLQLKVSGLPSPWPFGKAAGLLLFAFWSFRFWFVC